MCIKASIKFVVNWVLNGNKYRLNGNKTRLNRNEFRLSLSVTPNCHNLLTQSPTHCPFLLSLFSIEHVMNYVLNGTKRCNKWPSGIYQWTRGSSFTYPGTSPAPMSSQSTWGSSRSCHFWNLESALHACYWVHVVKFQLVGTIHFGLRRPVSHRWTH